MRFISYFLLMPLGKVWVHLFDIKLWINSCWNWAISHSLDQRSRRRTTLNSKCNYVTSECYVDGNRYVCEEKTKFASNIESSHVYFFRSVIEAVEIYKTDDSHNMLLRFAGLYRRNQNIFNVSATSFLFSINTSTCFTRITGHKII